jgi:AcrR family transcriptional regulator
VSAAGDGPGRPGRSGRTGRRPGDRDTRDAILQAARRCFGDHGFTGATIRMIAGEAGVDPALVLHYFGAKADLFAAAVELPVAPSEIVATLADVDPDRLGETLLRMVVGLWEDPEGRTAWLGLVRSATSDERAARMLRELLTDGMFRAFAEALGVVDAERRLALVASQIVGLGVARHVIGLEPLATMAADDLVAAVAPTLQRYLTGDLDTPG